jgi:Ferritin-like domain
MGRTLRTAAGATVGTGAALAATSAPVLADTPVPSDPEALAKVLEVERLVVLGYRQVLASGVLGPADDAAVQPFLAHELEHVATLVSHLKALGASADASPLDVKAGESLLGKYDVPGSLTGIQSRKDGFRLLVDLESVAEGAYFTALKTLGTAELQTMSAQAMACEAQHWTVLSGLRNPGLYVKSVPWPFVTGSS